MNIVLMRVLVAVLLAVPSLAVPACAGDKAPAAAFGKELVPDETTEERNESKSGEVEDEKDDAEERARHLSAHHRGGGGAAGHGRIHIQLDGDEDGGGDDLDDAD